MNRTVATIFYYCFAVILVYLIVITFFNTADYLSTTPGFGIPKEGLDYLLSNDDSQNSTSSHEPNTTASTIFTNQTYSMYSPDPPCSDMENKEVRNFITSTLYQNFYWCAYPQWSRFQGIPEQMLANWVYSSYVCDQEDGIADIPLLPYPTKNKTYWGITPRCQDHHTLVTLGVRDDSQAIRKMKESWKNLVTYGTHAIGWRNKDYDHFYNYAIGVNGSGIQTIYDKKGKIVELKERSVKSFFRSVLRLRRIDMLWVNLEGGEFEYWKYFGIKGIFTQMGITVCQMNLEFNKNDGVHFEKFLIDLFTSQWYIWMRPMVTQKERITRGYFVNIQSPLCVRKYLR